MKEPNPNLLKMLEVIQLKVNLSKNIDNDMTILSWPKIVRKAVKLESFLAL